MDTVIDEFKIKRVSPFKEEYLLIIFSILLYIQLYNYVVSSKYSDSSIVGNSIEYVVLFIALVSLYFPKKITFNQKVIFITTALIYRIQVLFYLPVLSSDLHRNLLFGSVLADGWNPYLWTIQQLPQLFHHGFVSKVSFTTEWASHSFDYPSLAIFFFAIITFLVPADNFSGFVLAKAILMIFDILNAYIIYKILKDHFNVNEIAIKVALLYLLNPISVFWINIEGQFESVPLFFILISIYLLFLVSNNSENALNSKRALRLKDNYIPYIIGFTLGCGVLFKYFPLIYAIPILFYFGRKFTYSLNFLFSLIITVVLLSIPFILNSYYITNFLMFQLSRNGNTVNDTNYNIGFGFQIPGFFVLITFLALLFLFSLYKKFDKKVQTSILGLFAIYGFIYVNNSIFSWYVLWLFGTLFFINTNYDDFFRSLLWTVSLILLILILDPKYVLIVVEILVISYIITLEKLHIVMKRILPNFISTNQEPVRETIISNKF